MMFNLDVKSNSIHDVEINVISAEKLTIDDKPINSKAFVTVGTGDGCFNSTRVNEVGGKCPCWNEKLRVNLPRGSREVIVEVRRRSSSGDRMIGTTTIPVSDFTGEYCVPMMNHPHFLSYRLRDAKGVRNGIINVSVRVMSSTATASSSAAMPEVPISIGFGIGSRLGTVIGFPVAGTGIKHEGFKWH